MEFETQLAGPFTAALRSNDRATAEWLIEFLHSWFVPSARAGAIQVSVSNAEDSDTELSDEVAGASREVEDVLDRYVDASVALLRRFAADGGVADPPR